MRRREFITLVGAAAISWPVAARAQSATVARVGFLRQAGPDDRQFDAFRGGLRAAGYTEGQNIVIEQRYAAGAYDRLPGLAMELVRSNVEIIVVDGTAAAKACKDATTMIPVVFTLAVDPVADGLAASFARPEEILPASLWGLVMTSLVSGWNCLRTWSGLFRASQCSATRAIRRMFAICVRLSGLRPRSVSTCGRLK